MLMPSLAATLGAALEETRAADLYRTRRIVEAFPDPDSSVTVIVDGKRCINFCGNDYLGLSQHPAVRAGFIEAARRYGVGSGASHLVSGHSREHHALEEELAAFVGRPRALLLSTGYMANLAAISALARRGDFVAEDRLNHASLLDAALVSGARLKRYAHRSSEALDRLLAEQSFERAIVATDGVFSMDGDIAPLAELAKVCRARGAWLVVDDAHGIGVIGATGRGSLETTQLGLEDVPVLVGTLGKALGTFGAFIAGSSSLIEFLIQRARSYIYTTALPPAVAAATRAALRIVNEESWRRDHLNTLVERFRSGARQLNVMLADSRTPIQAVLLGEPRRALEASSALAASGFWIAAIRPPTVPTGTSRLRITLSAAHTDEDVDRLLNALAGALR
jgi:8-amino-7-oxononanoate synthase